MRLVSLLVFAACSSPPGATSSIAEAGTPTVSDPTTAASGGLLWVDAEGQVVDGVVVMPEGLALMDADGIVWRLAPESDDPFSWLRTDQVPADMYYTDPACEGPWVDVRGQLPRYAVPVYNDPNWGGRSLVIDDDATPQVSNVYKLSAEGNCNPWTDQVSGIAGDRFSEVTPPSVTWTPPLHPELR